MLRPCRNLWISAGHDATLAIGAMRNRNPGHIDQRSRHSRAFKKINSWVRPGVCEIRAQRVAAGQRVIRLDFADIGAAGKCDFHARHRRQRFIEGKPRRTASRRRTAFALVRSASHQCRGSCEGVRLQFLMVRSALRRLEP